MAGNKYIMNNAGVLTEAISVNASAGVADANKIVALDASGILSDTIINSTSTSAGIADAGKRVELDATGRLSDAVVNATATTAGVADAGKRVKLDAAGKLDISLMPVGVAAETDQIVTSEALAAGDFVNIWNSTGAKVRKADAASAGKEAHGFVLAAVILGGTATVYRISQLNNALIGKTPGAKLFLSATTPGSTVEVAPNGSGQTVQLLGVARSATEAIFFPSPAIVLA